MMMMRIDDGVNSGLTLVDEYRIFHRYGQI